MANSNNDGDTTNEDVFTNDNLAADVYGVTGQKGSVRFPHSSPAHGLSYAVIKPGIDAASASANNSHYSFGYNSSKEFYTSSSSSNTISITASSGNAPAVFPEPQSAAMMMKSQSESELLAATAISVHKPANPHMRHMASESCLPFDTASSHHVQSRTLQAQSIAESQFGKVGNPPCAQRPLLPFSRYQNFDMDLSSTDRKQNLSSSQSGKQPERMSTVYGSHSQQHKNSGRHAPDFCVSDNVFIDQSDLNYDDCLMESLPKSPSILHTDASNLNKKMGVYWSSHQEGRRSPDSSLEPSSTSGNTTENVRVNSSFHVAEIVGKQGVKIKKIRANTNTWIKTPARGQEPIFMISGRKEGVDRAKAEILMSNDKVSKLRELRGKHPGEEVDIDGAMAIAGNLEEGSVVLKVSVPSNAVGLVIGPKGCRVRDIADATNTYIKTPSRYREPVFEVYGHPADVIMAKEQIMSFIHETLDDEYIKHLMVQLPIHEPGSPISSSPSVYSPMAASSLAEHMSPGAQLVHNFTRLRPFSPQLMPSLPSTLQPSIPGSHMYADLMQSYPAAVVQQQPVGRSLSPLHQPVSYPLPRQLNSSQPLYCQSPISLSKPGSRMLPFGGGTVTPPPNTSQGHMPMSVSPSPVSSLDGCMYRSV